MCWLSGFVALSVFYLKCKGSNRAGDSKMSHFQKGNKSNDKLIIRQIIAKDDNYKIT